MSLNLPRRCSGCPIWHLCSPNRVCCPQRPAHTRIIHVVAVDLPPQNACLITTGNTEGGDLVYISCGASYRLGNLGCRIIPSVRPCLHVEVPTRRLNICCPLFSLMYLGKPAPGNPFFIGSAFTASRLFSLRDVASPAYHSVLGGDGSGTSFLVLGWTPIRRMSPPDVPLEAPQSQLRSYEIKSVSGEPSIIVTCSDPRASLKPSWLAF